LIGFEAKQERFIAVAGQPESYIGGGVQSFKTPHCAYPDTCT